jgi:ABC-type molybdate transport system substrate-binding protein
MAAERENAGQQVVALPDELSVGAEYGLTVVTDASSNAYRFALFILGEPGQRILMKHGFATPTLPE